MFKRVMFAVVGIPFLFVVFFALPPVWLPVLFSALSMMAVYEVLWATGLVRQIRILIYSIVGAGLIPFWVYLGGNGNALLCGIFCYVFLLFCEALASGSSLKPETMGYAFLFTLIIPWFLSAFVRIRTMDGGLGIYYIFLPLVAAFASDSFALFAGMAFGKHKLAPNLSPKKTVEGSVGGLLGAVTLCCVYGLVMQFGFDRAVSYPVLVVYGALGSAIAQFGDLSFSYIKRQFGLKDFGRIFLGHGGVLDRFDSVVFCAPLIEILIWLLPALS